MGIPMIEHFHGNITEKLHSPYSLESSLWLSPMWDSSEKDVKPSFSTELYNTNLWGKFHLIIAFNQLMP